MTDREKNDHKPAAFEIDTRITLFIDYELSMSLGRLILESDTRNTALLALGHQLKGLSDIKM